MTKPALFCIMLMIPIVSFALGRASVRNAATTGLVLPMPVGGLYALQWFRDEDAIMRDVVNAPPEPLDSAVVTLLPPITGEAFPVEKGLIRIVSASLTAHDNR